MAKKFIIPERLKPGDKVAIVAPSSGAAAMFPWVYELGLKRMREIFQLEPVAFPTAQKDNDFLRSNPQARAEDINRAFADKNIKATVATIGGDDQIKILPFLDKKVISSNPKIFLGLSDNTNLHLFLWNLGIISYYGGSLMQQWAQNGQMDDYTFDNFRKALFENQIGEIKSAKEWTDIDFEWSDKTLLDKPKPTEPNPGWFWHNADGKNVSGRLWGGCWEIIVWHLWAEKYLPATEDLKGAVLFMETSEELPPADYLYRSLVGLGIKGWLQNFSAVLVGRAKTQHRGHSAQEGREQYTINQREKIIQALNEYAPDVPAVFGLDFGHTDPQFLVPSGAIANIDGINQKIEFTY